MSKVAVITDTHAGVKNGSDIFLDYSEKFYRDVFFPHLLNNGITKILHLGDYFDNRKVANMKVLMRNKAMFLDKLREHGMTMDIIPGNHDCFFKNTNDLCSLVEILQHYDDVVNIHMKPTVVDYYGFKIALLPWINSENHEESMEFVRTANASFLGGHLEFVGFEMMKGAPPNAHGMDASPFSRYDKVLTGHFHTKSNIGNVYYLGSPFELTWADSNDPKYFHVIDTETRKLTPVRNNLTLYNKLTYSDRGASDDIDLELNKHNFESVSGSFVKVIVEHKENTLLFDKFIDKVIDEEPFDLKIVENLDEFLGENVDDEGVNVENTIDLLNTYVDNIETPLDKYKLKSKLNELYVLAQNDDAL